MRSFYKVLLILALTLTTTGCWDRVEIEQRGFVIGIAIDKPPATKVAQKKEEKEAPNKPGRPVRFAVTYQFVVPAALQQKSSGGKQGDAFLNMTSEGNTMFEIARIMATRASRTPYFEHLKLIVISEKVAESKEFADILDFYIRDPEMRRGAKVMIAKGQARDVLEVVPKNEKLPTMYINSVAQNTKKSARMIQPMRLGDLNEYLLKKQSYALQRITPDKKEDKIAGSAVFNGKSNQMVGFLGEEEAEGLNFITGKMTGGILEIPLKGGVATFETKGVNSRVDVKASGLNDIKFTIHIEVEGNLGEAYPQLDFLDPKVIANIQENVKKEVKRLTADTIKKVQKDFKVDVLGLGEALRENNFETWQQLKDDWDNGNNYFSKSRIQVDVDVHLREIGVSNQSHQ